VNATSGPDEINIGRLAIEIPADCPNRSVFESVVREEFEDCFGNDSARAAYCKSEYDRCQQVPPEFAVNRTAASRYQSAQMALSPAAEKWRRFVSATEDHFSDQADDGDFQEPAIPGWSLSQLKATLRERRQAPRRLEERRKVDRDQNRDR
jgi:hypothetical protein